MNANFLQEMTAVQEAFDMWKTNHYDDSKIPTNGIVQSKDIVGNGRLYGEIAYYRKWSESENNERPEKDVLNKNCFDDYQGDLIVVPRGVEDLFYLNNEEIGIKNDNVYIIDAVNSMIYKIKGYTIKSVDVHSLAMYREVTGGNVDVRFASAEVEGSGDNIKYAGEEYYKDKDGNYVDENGNIVDEANKVKNPYGFRIIADRSSNNIYKLYNNGDLYAKGVKGFQMNTPIAEQDKLDTYKFTEWSVNKSFPSISSYKKIIQGYNIIYVIDNNDNLWAVGDNDYNRLGLTEDEQNEYTGRVGVKLTIKDSNNNIEKVKNVVGTQYHTWVITTNKKLFVAGDNVYGEAGLGNKELVKKFTQVKDFSEEEVENITQIQSREVLSVFKIGNGDNQKYYIFGTLSTHWCDSSATGTYLDKTQIFDGKIYPDIDQDIVDANFIDNCVDILKKDGTFWRFAGYSGADGGAGYNSLSSKKDGNLTMYNPTHFGATSEEDFNITKIWRAGRMLVERTLDNGEKEYYAVTNTGDEMGVPRTNRFERVQFPEEMLNNDSIKEISTNSNVAYYVMNSGKVWASGEPSQMGPGNKNIVKIRDIVCITKDASSTYSLPLVETAFDCYNELTLSCFTYGTVLFKSKQDGKYYTIGNSNIMFGDEILQRDWIKINPKENGEYIKVADFKANGVIIDSESNLWIVGNDSRYLGLGEETQRAVLNYEKNTDEKIKNNVKDAYICNYCIFVLTLDGKLYACGDYENQSLYGTQICPGWEQSVGSCYSLREITGFNGKVEKLYAKDQVRDIVTVSNKGEENEKYYLYIWGWAYGWTPKIAVPTLDEKIDSKKIISFLSVGYGSFVLTEDEIVYASSGHGKDFIGMNSTNGYAKHEFLSSKGIVQMVSSNNKCNLFLAEDGKLYGFGEPMYLGEGTSSVLNNNPREIDISKMKLESGEKIEQIAGGPHYFVAVTNKGRVFGTGKNTYGILGRWAGSNRSKPNSRYQTAFEWVECPELEL